MSAHDWAAVRREFPALCRYTFLNTATYGQLPQRAVEAAVGHFHRRDEKACTDFISWFEDLDLLRASIARLINASAQDIAFFPTASSALALIMSGIDWQPGDEILTLEDEYPNQLYVAQSLEKVRAVECQWSELDRHVGPRTRLVLLSTVNYVTGVRPAVEAMIPRLRDAGVLVYLDGTQSLGALRFDCGAIQPDFLAVDAYKWMLSPNGAGFLYVRPDVRAWLRPNVVGWRSDRDWKNVDCLRHGEPRFSDTAEKYEGGMLPFTVLYAMQASLCLIEELGIDTIEARVLELASLLRQEFHRIGAEFDVSSGECLPSQIVAACFPGADASLLAKELAARNIIVSARRGYLRVSPNFYNSEEDIAVLISALHELLS
jgi:cysteine desulfurase / selenocysteine lyase